MGGFVFVRRNGETAAGGAPGRERKALDSMHARGLVRKALLTRPGFELHVYRKRRFDSESVVEFANGDFIVATGTMLYRNARGNAALRELFQDFAGGRLSFEHLYGHFAVLIGHGGQVTLFNDYQGVYQVYHNADCSLISSSFLAVYETLTTRTPSVQELYEYVSFRMFYGNRTVIEEIGRLEYREVHQLLPGPAKWTKRIELPVMDPRGGFDSQVAFMHALICRYFEAIVSVFGDRISIGLTGGYDSRLVVAHLRRCGANPRVYVQGAADATDVRIAKQVAATVGFEIEHDAKEASPEFTPDEFLGRLVEAYRYLDGFLPAGLFDNWSLVATERSRLPRPELLRLYGMGGEIFRRTLPLPDRPSTFHEFFTVQADKIDYSPYSGAFDKSRFYEVIGDKMADEMRLRERRLTPAQTELAFPHFRLTRNSGWQMTVQNERAHALVPFAEPLLTYPSANIVTAYRKHGRFQSALIQRADPAMAAVTSAYGYAFSDGPGMKARLRTAADKALPIALRPALHRFRDRRSRSDKLAFYLQRDYLERILPDGCHHVAPFVDIHAIKSPAMLSRALTLELLLSGRLAEESARRDALSSTEQFVHNADEVSLNRSA